MIKPHLYGDDPRGKRLAQSIAAKVLQEILVMLHPVMPFVTEEIWQKLPQSEGSVMLARFPEIDESRIDEEAEAQMQLVMDVVSGVRNIRGEMNVAPSIRVEAVCLCKEESERWLLESQSDVIVDLAKLSRFETAIQGEVGKPRFAAGVLAGSVEIYVLLQDILDFDNELKRLGKEKRRVEKEYGATQRKLQNSNFLEKAPSEVVAKERDKAERFHEKLGKLRQQIERIEQLRAEAS